jgi:hypothetical protein
MTKMMRLLPAVAAVVFSVAAQASTISETLTGTITSGNDTEGNFGGGDLTGDSFTFSFSYDVGLLTNDTFLGTDGSFHSAVTGSYDVYKDFTADGAVSESLTISSHTFSMTSNFVPSEGDIAAVSAAFDGTAAYIEAAVQSNLTPFAYMDAFLYSPSAFSVGQMLSQNTVDASLRRCHKITTTFMERSE